MEKYDENYFENGKEAGVSLYENYRWMPELTIPFVQRYVEYLKILPEHRILDSGCAKGYTIRAFKELGFGNAWGVDVSEYAVSHVDETVGEKIILIKPFCPLPFTDDYFDIVIAKDTLEHMTEEELDHAMDEYRRLAKRMFFVIPIGDGVKYNCAEYEKDITHVLRKPMDWWMRKFQDHGFKITVATQKVKGIKENWYAPCDNGNGFFTMERL